MKQSVNVMDEPETDSTDVLDDEKLASVEVPEQFAVRDEATANWLVRKVVEADAHIARVKEQADREIRRTQHERDFLMLRYGRQLESWARLELANHKGRRKSVNLLSGTVGFRSHGEKLIVDDESKLLKWAEKNCRAAVVVVHKIAKTAINNHFDRNGELPSGMHLEPPKEVFFVK